MKSTYLVFITAFFLTTCHFSSFYSDTDDPGLSRFTSRGYNVASVYINEKPFFCEGSIYFSIFKQPSGNTTDTLQITFRLWPNDSSLSSQINSKSLYFSMPVPSSFNKNNLIAFSGRRFLNTVPIAIKDSAGNMNYGMSTLYFVSVKEEIFTYSKYLKISGLFDARLDNGEKISKGRFDMEIDEKDLNF